MRRSILILSISLLLAACGVDLGPPHPWVAAADLTGVFAPEVGAPPVAAMPSERLRVVTYNVHFAADTDAVARAIRDSAALAAADLFLLQEIESYPSEMRSRTARLAEALGLGYAYVPARVAGAGTHGIALMSRFPVENLRVMELPRAELPGATDRRVAFDCDLRIGATETLHVLNVHLDTRINLPERVVQLRPAVVPQAARILVAGDFNSNPYLWSGHVVPVLPASVATGDDQADALSDFMGALGYQAATRSLGYTQRAEVIDLRLDAIYTRGLAFGAGGVERAIDVSDHWPLWLDVTLR